MGIDYFNFYELNSLQILLTLHKKNNRSNLQSTFSYKGKIMKNLFFEIK